MRYSVGVSFSKNHGLQFKKKSFLKVFKQFNSCTEMYFMWSLVMDIFIEILCLWKIIHLKI